MFVSSTVAAPAVIQKPPTVTPTPQASKPSSAIQKAMEATLASIALPVAPKEKEQPKKREESPEIM